MSYKVLSDSNDTKYKRITQQYPHFCSLRKHIIHDIPYALPSGAGASARDFPECPQPSSPDRAIPWDSSLIGDRTPAV